MQELIIKEQDLKRLKRIIHKNLTNSNLKLVFEYQHKHYTHPTKSLHQYHDYLSTIEAFNIKDKEQRISYIYDYLCTYLDQDMTKHNYCEFKDGTCIANRLGYTTHENNGCCYIIKKGLCKNLTSKGCPNPNPSCKLYMCSYLNKVKKVNYNTKQIYLTSCLFKSRDHNFFKSHYFISKQEFINIYLNKIKV